MSVVNAGQTSISVLGPLQLHVEGRPVLLRGQQRTLLLSLAYTPDRVVPINALVAYLWDDNQPGNVRAAVQWLINRLRAKLGDKLIETSDNGYRLTSHHVHLDVLEFRRLAAAADRAVGADQYRTLTRALALWRAPVFADVDSTELRRRVEPSLTQTWFRLLDRRIAIDVETGRHEAVTDELYELVTEHPMHERFWEFLILALHRSGRRADALAAYRDIVDLSRNQLGLEVTSRLAELQRQILDDDDRASRTDAAGLLSAPRSDGAPDAADPVWAERDVGSLPVAVANSTVGATQTPGLPALDARAVPQELPPDVAPFSGRSAELDRIDRIVRRAEGQQVAPVVVVCGAGGVGKTALANHWAHEHLTEHADGQLYVDLLGWGPDVPLDPAHALERMLRSLGVAGPLPNAVRDRSALLRSAAAGRRLLVVLDNAYDSSQVVPLLIGGNSATIVTSRNQMRGLVARHGALRCIVRPLAEGAAIELLAGLLGEDRVRDQSAEAADLLELCDHLPLAIRIVAERAIRFPDTALGVLTNELRDRRTRLEVLSSVEGAHSLSAVLSWSTQHIAPITRRAWRFMAILPVSRFSLTVAAAALDLPLEEARALLDQLVVVHLLHEHRPGWFSMDGLVRMHARTESNRIDPYVERATAARRVVDWYLHAVVVADALLALDRMRPTVGPMRSTTPLPTFDDAEAANIWLTAEYANVIRIATWAAGFGWHREICEFTWTLHEFALRGQSPSSHLELCSLALTSAQQLGDDRLHGQLLNGRGSAYAELHRYEEAAADYHAALDLLDEDDVARARVLANLGLLESERGRYGAALKYGKHAQRIYLERKYERGIAHNLDNLAIAYLGLGDYDAALFHLDDALRRNTDRGVNPFARGNNLTNMGRAHAGLGQHGSAVRRFEQAIVAYRIAASRRGEALARLHLGHSWSAMGDTAEAAVQWRAALVVFRLFDDPHAAAAVRALAE